MQNIGKFIFCNLHVKWKGKVDIMGFKQRNKSFPYLFPHLTILFFFSFPLSLTVCMCVFLCVYVCVSVYVHVDLCVYAFKYVYMYVHIYVYRNWGEEVQGQQFIIWQVYIMTIPQKNSLCLFPSTACQQLYLRYLLRVCKPACLYLVYFVCCHFPITHNMP